jgi:UDP-4-amino-4,6-dideoxy-N-acetyl-beta-L-altrosamine transaminase
MIPYARQSIDEADIEAVLSCLRSEWLTQGPMVPLFEREAANSCGASYAVAVNSATSALHVACMALGLAPGDWFWTSPNTFVASANCALYCGASVDFVDIDPRTYNMSCKCLEEKLEAASKNGKLPKIVMPVHFGGQSCEMAEIYALSLRYGFRVIEDASHAIGGSYQGASVGSGRFSDITVFSFHPAKILTTCEGGMAVTNKADIYERMLMLRTHGITSTPELMHPRPLNEIWNYQQLLLGYNYRMSDLHASLGLSQLSKVSNFVNARRAIARRYDLAFNGLPLLTPWQHPDSQSSYHLYPVRVKAECNKTQKEVYQRMRSEEIMVNIHYIPVYRQPLYEALGYPLGYCGEAERFFKEVISLPMYASLTLEEQTETIEKLKKIVLN